MSRPLNDLPVICGQPVKIIEPIEEMNLDAKPKGESLEER